MCRILIYPSPKCFVLSSVRFIHSALAVCSGSGSLLYVDFVQFVNPSVNFNLTVSEFRLG